MIRYIFKRLISLLPTVAVPMILLFLLLRLAPGDPAATLLGEEATAADVAALRSELGLDSPLYVQFLDWLGRMARFDFGESLFRGEPVSDLVLQAATVTAQLAVCGLIVALLIGPLLGVIAGSTKSRVLDKTLVTGSAVGIATPTFWLAILMILAFSVGFGWFPVAGYVAPSEDFAQFLRFMTLPAISLGVLEAANLFRYSRNGVLDTKYEPFVNTARAQGLSERTITFNDVYRVAIVPVITVVGLSAASLLGGAVVTETVFSLPGIGQLLLTAVQRRDYPLIEGSIFFIAVLFVLINLVIDLICAAVDPRIRLTGKKQ